MGCGPKRFKLVWRCHKLLSGFLAKGQFPEVSRQSLMIRMIMRGCRGLCTDLLAFTLQLNKSRETSARRLLVKAMRSIIASNGVPYLQLRSVGSHDTSGKEDEGTLKPFYCTCIVHHIDNGLKGMRRESIYVFDTFIANNIVVGYQPILRKYFSLHQ
jgi:hypothetical protein